MPIEYGIYEYEMEQLRKFGDFRQWLYKIKNTETGNAFDYKIVISGTALASEGLRDDIQQAVDSKGEYLIKLCLDKKLEENKQLIVTENDINY